MEHSHTECRSHGWLDKLAMSMAAVCAVHCLLTPVLIVMLPILATTFFVHQDFHLWMLFFVIPTTSLAIFMGCRRHKDKWVAALSGVGLSILILALVYERQESGAHGAEAHGDACPHCVRAIEEEPVPLHAAAWFNVLGGCFLASGHFRNFRLCRKTDCQH